MKVSAYKIHDSIDKSKFSSGIVLETTIDIPHLMGILSRDIVLCNRINDKSVIIKPAAFGMINKVIIPIESASHPESDYGFGNVLFDIAMKETGV